MDVQKEARQTKPEPMPPHWLARQKPEHKISVSISATNPLRSPLPNSALFSAPVLSSMQDLVVLSYMAPSPKQCQPHGGTPPTLGDLSLSRGPEKELNSNAHMLNNAISYWRQPSTQQPNHSKDGAWHSSAGQRSVAALVCV